MHLYKKLFHPIVRRAKLGIIFYASNPLVSPVTTVNTSKTPHQLENFPLSISFLHLTVLISFTYQFEYEKKNWKWFFGKGSKYY